jgi:hypothetical protein
MTTIAIKCLECKKLVEFEADEVGLEAWYNGALIQQALPDLPASLREMLITEICPACFDKLFTEEDM